MNKIPLDKAELYKMIIKIKRSYPDGNNQHGAMERQLEDLRKRFPGIEEV